MPPKAPRGDKKDDKKDAAPGGGLASSADIFTFIGILILLSVFANALMVRLNSGGQGFGWAGEAWEEATTFYSSFKPLSAALSIMLGGVVAYLVTKVNAVRAEERKLLYPEKEESKEEVMNKKWQNVVDHLESDSPNDWKFAIIEADIILDEMLDSMGYHGDTVGDKLKKIEKSDFSTIDKAWEAHKVRNQIAHEGSAFAITKAEAVRVIELYKDVFQEFYFI